MRYISVCCNDIDANGYQALTINLKRVSYWDALFYDV